MANEMNLQRSLVAWMTERSWQTIPHVVFQYDPDVTAFMEQYRILKDRFSGQGVRLTMNTLVVKAVVEALKAAPQLNVSCSFDPETLEGTLEPQEHINAGVPWIMPDGGMLTVTMRELEGKSLADICAEAADIAARVANTDIDDLYRRLAADEGYNGIHSDSTTGHILPADVIGGTFTISNIGSLSKANGHISLLEILAPQVLVVGVSALQERPGVFVDADGEKRIGIRQVLPMCIALDHRAGDFADLAPFLNFLDDVFANPGQIMEW